MADDTAVETDIAAAVRPYKNLLNRFLRKEIEPDAFVQIFMDQYLADPTEHDEAVFLVIDRYFADLESYCGDPRLRDAYDTDENEIRVATRRLLERAGFDVTG